MTDEPATREAAGLEVRLLLDHVGVDAARLRELLAVVVAIRVGTPAEHKPADALQSVVDGATRLLGARFGILRIRRGKLGPERTFAAGLSSEDAERIGSCPLLPADALGGCAPLLVPDTGKDPAMRDLPKHHPALTSVVAIPVTDGGGICGQLCLAGKLDGSQFDESDLTVVEVFAVAASQAIGHAAALEEARQNAHWMEVSANFTQQLLAAQDEQTILEELAGAASALVRCDMVAVVTPLPETDEVIVRVSRGLGTEAKQGSRSPAASSISGLALATGTQIEFADVHAPDLGERGEFAKVFDPDRHLGPAILTPLKATTGTTGVLAVLGSAGRPPFPSDAAAMLQSFSGRAAMAMELKSARRAVAEAESRRTRDLEQANQALVSAMSVANRASQAKTDFLSRMSHELRTPLNSILGFGQLLEMDDLTEEQAESVHSIMSGGRHLLELINDVLDVGRIEAGGLALSLEPVSLPVAVESAVDMVAPLAERRDISIKVSETVADRYVRADVRRLTQVILNLVGNAVKFIRRGGHIWVDAESQGRFVAVSVRDDGPGIAPEHLPNLFQPFARFEPTGGTEGTGLGLALARGLTEAMGGTIEVRSEVGVGSTFTVFLHPAEARAAGQDVDRDIDIADTDKGAESRPDRLVVYVEDNEANWELLIKILHRRPRVRLKIAKSLAEWRELADKVTPDLVLLDLHLPDGHGLEALMDLKNEKATRGIPVVVVTADAMPGERKRMMEHGAVEYVTKPFDVAELLGIIDRFTG